MHEIRKMKKTFILIILVLYPLLLLGNDSVSSIKNKIIQESISSYRGSCPCPYNTDRAGRKCGRRSAYSRPGGYSPLCYESDVTDKMVEEYRIAHFANQKPEVQKEDNHIRGKVVKVIDGDTINILNYENKLIKVRLYGIDAPEKSQDFGEKSRKVLASFVAGENIDVTVLDIDRYGRYVGRILIDGKDLAEELLKTGMVWVYSAYCKIPECGRWKSMETQAKTSKIGLWSNPSAQAPWLWRKKHK